MIELTRGDIVRADAEALVNTVNCVGVIGRGVALQFRKAFPENFKVYKAACDRKEVRPGRMLVHELGRLTNPRLVINFPTKRHWKDKSRIEDIAWSDRKRIFTEDHVRTAWEVLDERGWLPGRKSR